jgi:hypothetical protein
LPNLDRCFPLGIDRLKGRQIRAAFVHRHSFRRAVLVLTGRSNTWNSKRPHKCNIQATTRLNFSAGTAYRKVCMVVQEQERGLSESRPVTGRIGVATLSHAKAGLHERFVGETNPSNITTLQSIDMVDRSVYNRFHSVDT